MSISQMKYLGVEGSIALMAFSQKNYIANVCGVNECTVRRWRRENNYPEYARRLIAIEAGFLPWTNWDGWRIVNGQLYSPALKDGFTPQVIESIHYLKQRCDHLEKINNAPAQYLLKL